MLGGGRRVRSCCSLLHFVSATFDGREAGRARPVVRLSRVHEMVVAAAGIDHANVGTADDRRHHQTFAVPHHSPAYLYTWVVPPVAAKREHPTDLDDDTGQGHDETNPVSHHYPPNSLEVG